MLQLRPQLDSRGAAIDHISGTRQKYVLTENALAGAACLTQDVHAIQRDRATAKFQYQSLNAKRISVPAAPTRPNHPSRASLSILDQRRFIAKAPTEKKRRSRTRIEQQA